MVTNGCFCSTESLTGITASVVIARLTSRGAVLCTIELFLNTSEVTHTHPAITSTQPSPWKIFSITGVLFWLRQRHGLAAGLVSVMARPRRSPVALFPLSPHDGRRTTKQLKTRITLSTDPPRKELSLYQEHQTTPMDTVH